MVRRALGSVSLSDQHTRHTHTHTHIQQLTGDTHTGDIFGRPVICSPDICFTPGLFLVFKRVTCSLLGGDDMTSHVFNLQIGARVNCISPHVMEHVG